MKRYWEIDALRGLMLVLMTVTHLPTRLTDPLGQPFGFVSAAEGFVLLSAFVSGLVYSRIARTQGVESMRRAFWRRALKVYLSQAATLLFLFTVISAVGLRIDQPAVKNLLSFYLANPREGFLYFFYDAQQESAGYVVRQSARFPPGHGNSLQPDRYPAAAGDRHGHRLQGRADRFYSSVAAQNS